MRAVVTIVLGDVDVDAILEDSGGDESGVSEAIADALGEMDLEPESITVQLL